MLQNKLPNWVYSRYIKGGIFK